MDVPINYNEIIILDLSNKSLTELPIDISKYSSLEEINLSGNKFSELPESIGTLKNLTKINLSKNRFKELPVFIESCKQLKDLNISKNLLTELPDFFRNFKELTKVDISFNPIKKIPFSLWKIEKLEKLNISGLKLDSIPVEIGSFNNLTVLKINKLQIDVLPDAIGYLKKLQELYIDNNNLEVLPTSISNCKGLRKISLKNNKFQFFPKTIFKFKSLIYVDVSKNVIRTIPKQIGDLKELAYLNVVENKIKGIPVPLYSLTKLKISNFHYENNLFSRVLLKEIKNKFTWVDIKKKEINKQKRTIPFKKNTEKKINEIKYRFSDFSRMHIPLIVILLIILLLLTFYFYDGQAAANKVKDETIAKERLLIKRVEDYIIAKQDFKAAIARMLKKTEEVYIYTNDKAYLELTMRPNRMPKAYNYLNDNEENLELLQSFLGNKHYGFSVKINRSKTKFTQMWLHDSVIPTRYAKKFRVVKYYKMTPEEIIYNKERDKKRIAYRQNPRNDKVYAINRGIVDFNELKNKKFFKKTREIFTPRDIDLTRKNNYFYFSSLNANVSEKEFLEAVKEFNKMFIKKGNPNKLCFVKKYKVRRE